MLAQQPLMTSKARWFALPLSLFSAVLLLAFMFGESLQGQVPTPTPTPVPPRTTTPIP